MSGARRVASAIVGAVAVVGLVLGRPLPVDAATSFGTPEARADFGREVVFEQPVVLDADVARIEVLVEVPGALGPFVEVVDVPARQGPRTLTWSWDANADHLLPNTTLTARWRIVTADGAVAVGPPVSVTYADTRFDWRTDAGELVRVHWYEGSDAFGRRALEIGEAAIAETAALLGVTESDPVDFFVYADQQAFYDALGPGTRENVGGQANPDLRTLFALITPGEIDDPWVEVVVPHELVHLVFDTAVDNPYHYPPRWLNEGVAVYLSEGYGPGDREAVERAAADGSLIPLDGLAAQFPTTRERFFLAYAESVSAVDYLIRAHGRDALIALIRSYADGVSDDEAFEAALGLDLAGFDAAWRADLDAAEPAVHGPRPAPPGPLPPGWEAASPAPGAGSPPPGAPVDETPRPTPVPGAGGNAGGPSLPLVLAVVAALVGVVGIGLLLAGRRAAAVAAPPVTRAPDEPSESREETR